MIPKKIHYCWFGGNPKPELADKCISSWKKYCPDYEITEWNEENFSISESPLYVRQAYEAKQWAFVTDYVRLKVIAESGGIYFDTDVELIKGIDDLLQNDSFFCTENEKFIATGLGFGAVPQNECVLLMLADYETLPFFLENEHEYNRTPCPVLNTLAIRSVLGDVESFDKVLKIQGNLFLTRDYFCPLDFSTRLLLYKTQNTRAIHWAAASWLDENQRKARRKLFFQAYPTGILMKILGINRYNKLKSYIKSCSIFDFAKKQFKKF